MEFKNQTEALKVEFRNQKVNSIEYLTAKKYFIMY